MVTQAEVVSTFPGARIASHCGGLPVEVSHQFASRNDHARHPVFFALSCHTNELGGELAASARASLINRVHRGYIAPAMLRNVMASASQASVAPDASAQRLVA